jgi:PAS domain S-box-containing protein
MASREAGTSITGGLQGNLPQIGGSWMADVFDRSLLGIVQTDTLGNVLYVNPKGNEICGYADLRSKTLHDLFPDAESYGRIQQQLAARHRGLSDEYEIQVTREDGRTVPISVSSMPVISEFNEVGGAISIFRSLELEKARLLFDQAVSSAENIEDLLGRIALLTMEAIPFDLFRVSFFSRDGGHARVAFEYPNRPVTPSARWMAISEAVRELVLDYKPSRHNLIDLLKTGQEGLEALVRDGFRWSMRCPVYRLSRLMGSVAVFTKDPAGFTDRDFDVFRELPLDKALAAVLFFDAFAQLQFTVGLAKRISRCETEEKLFSKLTEELSDHYGWSHVAIFIPDEIEQRLILQSQSPDQVEAALPENYSQPLETGVLGHVFRTGEDVRISDVSDDPVFKSIVVQPAALRDRRSELCMRITADGRTFALLNIEDFRENAFTHEEQEALRRLLDDLGVMIENRRVAQFEAEAVKITPTALFMVNGRGIIRYSNPAAQSILEYSSDELNGTSIERYVAGIELGKAVATATHPTGEIELVSKTDRRIPGMVAGLPLHGTANRRLITFRDISVQRKAQKLDSVTKLYTEIARQTKPALAMIGASIADLREIGTAPRREHLRAALGHQTRIEKEMPQTLELIASHLRYIESALDKVMILSGEEEIAGQPMTIYMPRFVHDLKSYLPAAGTGSITFENETLSYVHADPGQLSLVIETILSYLLRFRKASGRVKMFVSEGNSMVDFCFSGYCSKRDHVEYLGLDDITHARTFADMSLGEAHLRRIVERQGGFFHSPVFGEELVTIRFELPVSEGSAA